MQGPLFKRFKNFKMATAEHKSTHVSQALTATVYDTSLISEKLQGIEAESWSLPTLRVRELDIHQPLSSLISQGLLLELLAKRCSYWQLEVQQGHTHMLRPQEGGGPAAVASTLPNYQRISWYSNSAPSVSKTELPVERY